MIPSDQAIAYETKKFQVKKAINALEAINLNVTNFKTALEEIDTNCKKNVNYSSAPSGTTALAFSGLLENAYLTGISKLDSLYLELKRYEVYVQVSAFNGYLQKFLTSGNIRKENMGEIRNQLVKFLNAIKNSDTLDYEVEGPIVEDIYNLALSFIELETKTFGSSTLIPLLSIDDIHHYNLDKVIVRRLEKLDLKSLKYQVLKAKKDEIDQKGFESTYLNQDFISILASTDLDEEQVKKTLNELLTNMENYEGRMNDILNDINENNEDIKSDEENKKRVNKNYHKKLAIGASYFGLLASMITGTILLGKKICTDAIYETSITTYSKEKGKRSETGESLSKDSAIQVYKYSPYFKTKSGYQRNVICYDLPDSDKEFEDYLTMDYTDMIGEPISEPPKETLIAEDRYTENYLEVVKTKVNTEKSKLKINENIYPFCFGALIMDGLIWLVLEVIYSNLVYKSTDHFLFESDFFREINEIKGELKEIRNDLKTGQNSNANSEKELLELQKLSLKTISLAEKTLKLIENSPEFSEEKAKLETAIAKVRKLSNQ